MSSPNSALAAWQLTLMAVIAVGALAVWLAAVYRADRQPRWRNRMPDSAPVDAGAGVADPGQQTTSHGDRIAA